MNILLISQCKKNALKATRRIIDQFAERCGDRTWQTAITQHGLNTIQTLLKKAARKNTAVSCYWVRSKNKTELLWIVGDRSQFNEEGRVPTNRTKRNILRSDRENSWQYGTTIQIISTLAALLHDLGKATVGFQEKLKQGSFSGDPYRHEWISLHLFVLMLDGCQTNEDVLNRLMNFETYQEAQPDWFNKLTQVNPDSFQPRLDTFPVIAKWLGWLIASHHRMPFLKCDERYTKDRKKINPNRDRQKGIAGYIEEFFPIRFFKQLEPFVGWVHNLNSDPRSARTFWQLAKNVTDDKIWLSELHRWAKKALNHLPLMELVKQGEITNRFLLQLSRLSLMVGDHNFSSKDGGKKDSEQTDCLIANTNASKQPKQYLNEHLLGVSKQTAKFARLLPNLATMLPTLVNYKALVKRTQNKRFSWQNHAFDLGRYLQQPSEEAGFFGVNMASTGCGKTLANCRILYGLADPKRGMRLTIALGLRVLTLQTGIALREKLGLNPTQLATLVGGTAAQRSLFERASEKEKVNTGSESTEDLFEPEAFVDTGSGDLNDEILKTVIADEKAKKLLFSPLVSCTIDHLTQSTECARGGRYILPTLRLLSSDLILDEPDDFDQNDLPALARLVHSAGLYGSKVLLSSATLTPDLIAGLFDSYQAGRKIWQQQQNKPTLPIPCAWFDEFNQKSESISCQNDFQSKHLAFVKQRAAKLAKGAVRRKADVMPLLDYNKGARENETVNFLTLAEQVKHQAHELHCRYHNVDPITGKKISIGLIRLSNTKNVIALTRAMYQSAQLAEDVQFNIVVYHAKQLLLLRSVLEEKLDDILNRSNPAKLFEKAEIRQVLDNSTAAHQLFIVIGTPITEVGRDHDYDWAILEPSSMRSIIQLAGRVWRHRPEKVATEANIAILGTNLNVLLRKSSAQKQPDFCRPGFESKSFILNDKQTDTLILKEELTHITAIPRITEFKNQDTALDSLSGLEHRVMGDLFNTWSEDKSNSSKGPRKSNAVTSYWAPDLGHPYCIHLQLLTPFRRQQAKEIDYVCQYNEDKTENLHFSTAEKAWQTPDRISEGCENGLLRYQSWDEILQLNNGIKPWLTADFYTELTNLKGKYKKTSLATLALQFATVKLSDESWFYHPWFGFYRHERY